MRGANPFQPAPGASPPKLVGRSAELTAIVEGCERVRRHSAPVPLAFLGLRGLGKTVLLNEVRTRTSDATHLRIEVERGVPLATSIHHALRALKASTESTPQRLGKAIERALRYIPLPSFELPHDLGAIKLSAPGDEPEPANLPIGEAIGELNEAVASIKGYLVITIDEVQDADIAGYRSLVAAVHQSAGTETPIFLASAGLPETAEVLDSLRTYAKRWDRFELAFLSRMESVEAIREPLAHIGVTIEDEAVDALANESAGYPYFVQRYASAAWNHHDGKSITAGDVAATMPGVRAMVEKTFYADEFRKLSPRERLFCKVLAEFGPGPHEIGRIAEMLNVKSSAISSLRQNLIKKGTIFAPSSGSVQLRMPLADRYIREHLDFFYDEAVKRYESEMRR